MYVTRFWLDRRRLEFIAPWSPIDHGQRWGNCLSEMNTLNAMVERIFRILCNTKTEQVSTSWQSQSSFSVIYRGKPIFFAHIYLRIHSVVK